METIHESSSSSTMVSSAETDLASYQVQFLLNEIAFLQDELKRSPWDFLWRNRPVSEFLHFRLIAFLLLHALQLYWTVTRFVSELLFGKEEPLNKRPQLNKKHASRAEGHRLRKTSMQIDEQHRSTCLICKIWPTLLA